MTVEITAYVPTFDPDKPSAIATVDVYLPKMKLSLRRLRLIKSTHGVFVSPPSYKTEEGEWVKMFEFDGRIQKILIEEILEGCEKFQAAAPDAPPTEPVPAEGIPF